jgi:hypothetical protein
LNIQSYGISISTLEEVFLKIGHLDDPIADSTHKTIENIKDQSPISEKEAKV